MYFPYAFPKSLYVSPVSNAILGMVANESDPLSQQGGGIEAAEALGLEVVSASVTYQVDTTDFTPVLTPVMRTRPDLLVLSGVAPANAPQLIRSARDLGFIGIISTETAQKCRGVG